MVSLIQGVNHLYEFYTFETVNNSRTRFKIKLHNSLLQERLERFSKKQTKKKRYVTEVIPKGNICRTYRAREFELIALKERMVMLVKKGSADQQFVSVFSIKRRLTP